MAKLIDANTGEYFNLKVAADGTVSVDGAIDATVQEPLDVNLTNTTIDVQIADAITVAMESVSGTFVGQITVTTSGVAVQGSNVALTNGVYLKGHVDNTDTVWILASGLTKTSGYPLNAGEQILVNVTNLNVIWADADVSGEKICWLKA